MPGRRKSGSKNRLIKEKNRIRGVIAASRSRAFSEDTNRRAAAFHRNLADVLVESREKVGHAHSRAFIDWVESQTQTQVPDLWATPTESGLSQTALDRKAGSLSEEVEWVATRLAPHAGTLSRFREVAIAVEKAALLADWDRANNLLDEIERDYGKSIWVVEARIAIAQAHGGLEAQKQIVVATRKAAPGGLVAYMAYLASVRNEPSTTLNTFFADVSDRLVKMRDRKSLRTFLSFRLLWNRVHSPRQLARVLLVAQGLSTVDLYETLVSVMQAAHVDVPSPQIGQALSRAIDGFKGVNDFRITKLALLTGTSVDRYTELRPMTASDGIVRGERHNGIRGALRELKREPRAFRTALMASLVRKAPTKLRQRKTGFWPTAIDQIASLLSFGDGYPSQFLDIEKLLRNFAFSPALLGCFMSIRAQLTDEPTVRVRCETLAALNNYFLDAEESALVPLALRPKFLKEDSSLSSLVSDINAGRPPAASVDASIGCIFRCLWASGLSLAGQLEELNAEVARSPNKALRVFVRRSYITALIEAGQIAKIISVARDGYFAEGMPASLIPLRNDFATLRWRSFRQLRKDLALPISLHLSWRMTGSDLVASNLRTSYDEFMIEHGLNTPADVIGLRGKWSDAEITYFLRFVCVPEIIDMSRQIRSSRAAQEARREVCNALMQIDPVNREIYEIETFEITRELSVQDGMRVLDSSRVHVDTSALTSWAMRELEPNVARYRALIEADVDISESLDDVLRQLSGKFPPSKKLLEIPISDGDVVLADLITTLKGKFLLDPNHGLDSYLSRRVRHHSMSGHLRGAVESFNLITTKDHQTGHYVPNEYWPDRIAGLSASEYHKLQRALAKFAEEFDKIILGLKTDLFRINSEQHPKGLFSVPISPTLFHIVRAAIRQELTVETLCNVCFPLFWSTLQPALDAAQSTLKDRTFESISAAFHRLKSALHKTFKDANRYAELSVAIQSASDDLNRKVVLIADWFKRSEASKSQQTFSLEQALEICIQAALHSLKPFTPKIKTDVRPGSTVSSLLVVQLADLVLTMLGNVRQHSACGKEPEVAVSLSLAVDGAIQLTVESQIGRDACDEAARKRVDGIRREIEDGTYVERIRNEKHSGLTKIASAALATGDGKIDFGFIENKRFFVTAKCRFPDILIVAVVPNTIGKK